MAALCNCWWVISNSILLLSCMKIFFSSLLVHFWIQQEYCFTSCSNSNVLMLNFCFYFLFISEQNFHKTQGKSYEILSLFWYVHCFLLMLIAYVVHTNGKLIPLWIYGNRYLWCDDMPVQCTLHLIESSCKWNGMHVSTLPCIKCNAEYIQGILMRELGLFLPYWLSPMEASYCAFRFGLIKLLGRLNYKRICWNNNSPP